MSDRFKKKFILVIIAIVCFILFLADVYVGDITISFSEIFHILIHKAQQVEKEIIFYNIRLPKALAAVLVGAALGVSGLLAQTYFRNPLAGPDVLGINTGASLGVSLIILTAGSFYNNLLSSFSFHWTIAGSAILGSALAFFIILFVSSFIKDNLTILILGLMLSAAYSAIITILQYFSNETLLKSFIVWSFGSLAHITLQQIYIMLFFIILGLLISLILVKNLNALLLGEKYALSIGVNIQATKLFIFLSISILAGVSTAFCGPIAFIAITVPHISRMILKTSDHLILLSATMLIGSFMLLISDLLSQLPHTQIKIPINAITSLMGIPIVIYILFQRKMY